MWLQMYFLYNELKNMNMIYISASNLGIDINYEGSRDVDHSSDSQFDMRLSQ